METLAKKWNRYVVDQFYMRQLLIVDTLYDEAIAIIHEFDDCGWDAKKVTEDAKVRAQAICDGLNLLGYNWSPPE